MSKNNPKISVIVPAHNVEDYIDKCLECLTGQTFQDIEIICVNDHSGDGTAEKLADWAKKDARIKVFEPDGRGLPAARNCGMDHAKAEFIMFCDSDDYYELTACEEMLKAIEESGTDLAICELNTVYQTMPERILCDEGYNNLHFFGKRQITDEMMLEINVYVVNKIFRKSIIDKYGIRFPEGRYYEDACFSFSYLYVADTAFFLERRLYNYIRRPNSMMSASLSKKDARDKAIDHVHVMIALYDFLKRNKIFEEHAVSFWRLFRSYESTAIGLSKSEAAVKKVQELVKDFVTQHPEDFALASIGDHEGIITMVPILRRTNVTHWKQRLLRFMPAYKIQIRNAERLQNLIERNSELLRELDRMIREYPEK